MNKGTLIVNGRDYSNGGNSGGLAINYSINEQDTGIEWIDGRHIYQKTITGTQSTATDTVSVLFNDADLMIDMKGVCKIQTGWNFIINTTWGIANNVSINGLQSLNAIYHKEQGILIGTHALAVPFTYYITLLYVKEN